MTVVMDFEIFPDAPQPANPNNPKYRDMKEMIKSKLDAFDKEIAENIEEDMMPVVVIRREKAGIALQYGDVPEHIEQKMMKCITYDDWDQLYQKWMKEDNENK